MKTFYILLALLFLFFNDKAQNVGISNDNTPPDSSAMLDIRNPNKGLLIPRVALTGINDTVTIHKPAVSLMIYNTSSVAGAAGIIPGFYYYSGFSWVRTTGSQSSPSYAIGQSLYGGIIFWLDSTGQHGLISSVADQSASTTWSNGSFINTQAVRSGIYAGYFNTNKINNEQRTGTYASVIASQFEGGNFGDWYLPSKGELNVMYQMRAIIPALSGSYWSSTEQVVTNGSISDQAWSQAMSDGTQNTSPKTSSLRVRAIRSF